MSAETRRIFVTALLGTLSVAAVGTGCTNAETDRDIVRCDRVEVDDRQYCIYRSQAITETGYDCPKDLSEPVPMGGGTVCTDDGTIPEKDRDDLREEVDPPDGGWSYDVNVGIDTARPPIGDTSVDAGGDADVGTNSCEAPSCEPTSSVVEPSYTCHEPARPPTGDAFTLTIFGQNFAARSDGTVEILTDTGFGQDIQVDHRCKVTVDLPAYVWGNGSSFTVTVKNSAGRFQFDVQGR